jgi:hypothetical protein
MATTTAKTSIATERGILFSAPMVRALLDGSKTQTRRVVKDLPSWEITEICLDAGGTGKWMPNGPAPSGRGMAAGHWRACPYGQPGDRLWGRETFQGPLFDGDRESEYRAHPEAFNSPEFCEYAADGGQAPEFMTMDDEWVCRWRPSIHMPRWASRILLEITGVRVERLQNISEADARAEGVTIENRHMSGYCAGEFLPPSIRAYRDLWESINGSGSWDVNPWVWVVEFKRVQP